MLFTILIVVITLIAILLVMFVLLQSGKGGGLSGMASGGATRQVLGARQAPDVLEKATWTLATIFIVLCLLTNFAIDRDGQQESIIQQRAGEGQTQQQQQDPVVPPLQQEGQAPPAGDQQPPPAGGEQTLPPAPEE